MAQHPVIGAQIVRGHRVPRARRRRSSAPTTSAGTAPAIPTASSGEEIPLSARVFAVADVLDALTTRPPLPPGLAAVAWRAR